MKLTNRLQLPEGLYNALAHDDYDKGNADYSVSGLLLPPHIARLRREHEEEITEDVADRIWSLFGKITHEILERGAKQSVVETRLYMDVLNKKVSGKFDTFTFEHNRLTDYKVSTVWKFKENVVPIEFEQQQNLYVHLFEANGVVVKEAFICGLLRDWSKREALRDKAYPQSQVVNLPVKIWPFAERQGFLEYRVALHEAAKERTPDICTPDERWTKPAKFAVLKQGAKRASKIFPSLIEAKQYADNAGMIVEKRDEENPRCESYCNVNRWCPFWKENVDPMRMFKDFPQ